MSSTPYEYVESTGVIVPDTSAILGGVQGEYQTVFGSDLIVTPDTPQGVLITAEALARTQVVNNNAALGNQINPNVAAGVFLDAIAALMGIQRIAATQTYVPGVNLAGVAGTVIPAGTQAQTLAGDIFASAALVTLDGSGAAIVDFYSVEFGPIPCPTHALSIVVTNVLGWETVRNNNAATIGQSLQSDQAFRAYRNNTLGFQGVALPVCITSALYATTGVTSLSFLENYDSFPMGMLISVTGGTTLAGTIWGMSTTTGSGTSGAIVVDTDPINFTENGQTLPVPNPWPVAAFSTTGDIALSGLATQVGGDWPSTLTAGDIILVKDQVTDSENGLWVADSGAWARQDYNGAGASILGSNEGISLIQHSIYACVDGGADLDVASALLENKSSGCAWNGGTTVNVVEPASGQTYLVQFDRPAEIGILVEVTSPNGNSANITQAVLDFAAGSINGLPLWGVGYSISPFEIAGAIMAEYPAYIINNVRISFTSPISYANSVLPIAQNQIAFTESGFITVLSA